MQIEADQERGPDQSVGMSEPGVQEIQVMPGGAVEAGGYLSAEEPGDVASE